MVTRKSKPATRSKTVPRTKAGRKMSRSPAAGQPAAVPAMRLIFEYDGDAVSLVSQQPVDMAVTGPDLAQVLAAGTFVDARDEQDRTLIRISARGLPDDMVEVFPEQAGQPIERVRVERPRGAFTVVLPVPEATARVAIVRVQAEPTTGPAPSGGAAATARPERGTSPAESAAQPLRARDLATFPLKRTA